MASSAVWECGWGLIEPASFGEFNPSKDEHPFWNRLS